MNPTLESLIEKASVDGKINLDSFLSLLNSHFERIEIESENNKRNVDVILEELESLHKHLNEESEAQLKTIMQNIGEGIILLDEELDILSSNTTANRIISPVGLEFLNDSWKRILMELPYNFFEQEQNKRELKLETDQKSFYLEISTSIINLQMQKRYLVFVRDITQVVLLEESIVKEKINLFESETKKRKEFEELSNNLKNEIRERQAAETTIEFLAFHDPLTGLLNRNSLNRYLREEIKNANNEKKIGILNIDLERFKIFNDTMGQVAGDELLRKIALRIAERTKSRGKAFRLGGDEFVIILFPVASEEELLDFSNSILAELRENYLIDSQEVVIDVVIGASLYPDSSTNVEELMKSADMALMDAKERGANSISLYNSKMSKKVFDEFSLERSLKKALKLGQFQLYYQPKISVETGKLAGLEGLLRWKLPEVGYIPPLRFIPIAEKKGLILEIGEWVLLEGCRTMVKWISMGFNHFTLAINLSPKQFEKPNIEKDIARILDYTGLPPKYLEFEITESTAMKDADVAVKVLKKLSELGVKISIDDFGTGYSSLSYLRKFPLNKLKIDKSFLVGIPKDKENMAITRGIVELAKSLELGTIAEGVETNEQYEFLKWINCDEVQGFLYGEAEPHEDITLKLVSKYY
ncbi:MAG: EAL domain-containing protein [Leptospiraceae bacterium]|nr:EAL domain-containing protein [Leptospiraceae bacterium]